MKLRLNLIISLLFIIYVLPVQAQVIQTFGIQQLIKYGLENNYDLHESRFVKLQSELKLKETRANGLPQIEGSLEYKDYLKLPTMILPGELAGTGEDIILQYGKKHNVDATIQASQLLFSLKYINGLKTTKKLLEIRNLEVEKAEVELYQQICTEYFNLLAIYKNLDIIESNMESLELTKQNVSALVRGGLALETELDRININYSNLEASKEQIISGIQIQTNNIKYIIGMQQEDQLTIDTTGFKNMFSQELFVEKYSTEQFNPGKLIEVKLLQKNIELNDYQIKTARSETTPTIAAFSSYAYQAQRNKFNFTDSNQDWFKINIVGVKATIPIFAGFANRAKINSARIERNLTVNKLNKASEGLNLQYQNSLMNYQTNIKNCNIQLKNVDLAKKVELQESLKYRQGISTLTDYLISISDYRNAQIDYVQSFIDMKKSEIELLKNQGLLRSAVDQYLKN